MFGKYRSHAVRCREPDSELRRADGSSAQVSARVTSSGRAPVSELCAHLDMSRQAVTKHLRILENAKLVVTVWRGREKLHYLNPVPIHEIAERWIGKFERQRLDTLRDIKKRLEGGAR